MELKLKWTTVELFKELFMAGHIRENLFSCNNFAKHLTELIGSRILGLFLLKLISVVSVSLSLNFVQISSSFFLKNGGFFWIKCVKQNLYSSFKILHLPFQSRVQAMVLLSLHLAPVSDLAQLFVCEHESMLPIRCLCKLNLELGDFQILFVNHRIFFTNLFSLVINLLFAYSGESMGEKFALGYTIYED